MGKYKDIAGQRFGRLVVVEKSHQNKNSEWYWLCRCDCGNEKVINGCNLRQGTTVSCGCFRREVNISKGTKHGLAHTRLYNIHNAMISRCFNSANGAYHNYGGRGITVCDEWLDVTVFYEWAQNSGYKKNLTIDRIDNNGIYEPNNCRWATQKEQCNNTRSNHLITVNGETKTLGQWAGFFEVDPHLIKNRLKRGWSEEKAVTTPPIFDHGLYEIERKDNSVTYNGRTMSLEDWAEELNIAPRVIYDRIVTYGWSPERAFTLPVRKRERNFRLVTFRGKTQSVKEWSDETGFPLKLLRVRLFDLGWSIERALTEPIHDTGRKKPILATSVGLI